MDNLEIDKPSNETLRKLDKMDKLHVGCGQTYIPGFFHIDIIPAPHVDWVGPVGELNFIEDNSLKLIYACHILEHFGRSEFMDILKEWYRVLMQGGILRLAVPNFEACAALYYEEGLRDGLTGLIGLISGGQRNSYDFHKMIFDEPYLTDALHEVGFREVRWWDWRKTEHSHIDDYSQAYLPHMDRENGRLMTLNLEGIK